MGENELAEVEFKQRKGVIVCCQLYESFDDTSQNTLTVDS
jgi:hypothetical protein